MVLVLILLAVAAAVAQSTAPSQAPAASKTAGELAAGKSFPLRDIRVEGNKNFPTAEIIALSGLKIGQQATPSDFEAAIAKINAAGVFDGLEFRYGAFGDGYQVTFKVEEVEELYPVRFAGFGVPDEEIQALLRGKVPLFGPKVPPTGRVIKGIGDTLQEYWTGLGKDSKVIGTLSPVGEGGWEMLFQPEGEVQTIAFTKFENTGVIPALELQRVFHNIGSGVPYSEERLIEMLRFNIGPLYEEKGRLEVSFCPCTTEPDTETKGLVVTVHVEEGPEYRFGGVTLPPESPLLDEYAKAIKFKSGELADMSLVSASRQKMESILRDNGFMNATVEIARKPDVEKKTITVAFHIDEGDRYTFNQLKIEGLDVVAEAALRKRWGLQIGDPFNASYPAFFLDRIKAEGMFDNLKDTGWNIQVSESKKAVDVTLTFR
jgi:outer membrane protein assembly factor BamA